MISITSAARGVIGIAAVGVVGLAPQPSRLLATPAESSATPGPATYAHSTPLAPSEKRTQTAADVTSFRLREGTRFTNRIGRFRLSGETLTFIDEDNREFGGLPNLNLERVIRMLKAVDEPETILWSVNGVVTEFSERNYLLISRAVYKAAAPPPAPESLSETAASPSATSPQGP
jgi:hypothetical protein